MGGCRDRQAANTSGRERRNTEVGGTASSCPPACGDARWIDTQAYCGDNARLRCTITENPADGPATVEILHPSNESVVATVNAQMTGGTIETTWVTKAQSANWRTDRIRFRVRAAGLTCESSNALSFRDRPTVDWARQDYMRSCPGGATQHRTVYDLKLDAERVQQRLKLKTRPGDGIDRAAKTRFEEMVVSRSQTTWNNGFRDKTFHRQNCQRGEDCDCAYDCCKVGYRLIVQFFDEGQHRHVNVVPQPDPPAARLSSWCRWDDSRWAYPPKAVTTYQHEVGHMIGQYDEYVTRCNDPSGNDVPCRQPAPPPADERNLMSHSGNQTLLSRHYRRALTFLNENSGEDPYDVVPPCS